MDSDLQNMSLENLIAEVKKLRDGIRRHRDSTRHELCWHHPALWGLLPEKTDPVPEVPDWPEFLKGCILYRESLDQQAPDAPRTKEQFMSFTELTPMLWTRDLKGSVQFYTDFLSFECESMSEEWGWASVKWDNVAVMFAIPNEHEPFERPFFTGSLYIKTDNVDTIWNHLKDKVKICYPIENFEYGMREFAIYDNNGYLLQFGQEM
jgi:Glyoxalase/Bleomycin resistance protein/Dioxygenase superfamily